MVTSGAPAAADRPLVRLREPYRAARAWRAVVDLLLSLPFAAISAAITVTWLALCLVTCWIVGVGALVRAATLWLSAKLAAVDRARVTRFTGARIPALPTPNAPAGASRRERLRGWAGAPWLWRLPAYQLVRLPLLGAAAFVLVGWAWATVGCFLLAADPATPVRVVAWDAGPIASSAVARTGMVLIGVLGILGLPPLFPAALTGDRLLAAALLGPSRSRALSAEVSRLAEARALAVQSAAAERRRIERDLHDGLQPQLVSLALDLGLAKAHFDRDPDGARELLGRAHREAKRAAADLRNLVRGIHPAVLDGRGLDAALSALVANCPVPVTIAVQPGPRAEATRDGIAYFVVAEAITNITKHANAQHASVTITGDAESLHVAVCDDGAGGARLDPDGGLAGLAARVASIDGRFTLTSPAGGPTRIEAVLPCAP